MSSALAFFSGIAQSGAVQANSGFRRVLLAVVVAAGLASCRTLEKKDAGTDSSGMPDPVEGENPEAAVLPIGVVQHVDETARFILVRSSRSFQIEPGTVLVVRGNAGEPLATVKVSPARKGAFLTADIIGGSPKPGQSVTMEYAPPGRSAPVPEGPPVSDAGGVQVLE